MHGFVSLEGALGITLPYSRSGRLDPVADGLRLADAASGAPGNYSACVTPGLRPMSF